ncbi:MAG: YafY family transcriptional regulator [Lachnospiraceae bacterium]|nr:YafY family transcriptional regulator [Lachnospiraceae bacterium]
MKIERLIGIITTLQQKEKVTAPYLADKFEVSRRTINRDIEEICRAGIPIVTTQGTNGGISLMEGFALDTTVFTEQELSAVFTGLKTLDSVSTSRSADKLASKIGAKDSLDLIDHMTIDLASFYKTSFATKIELIKKAINERRCISFRYYYNKGEADKFIEPYRIYFMWSDWYVFGYCKERQDFRLYKLRRLWDLQISGEEYEARAIPDDKLQFGSHMTDDYFVTAIYDSGVKYKLVEEYGPDSFTVMDDGKLYAKWGFNSADDALPWFLSLGDKVEVIEPPEMVEKMKSTLAAISKKYL